MTSVLTNTDAIFETKTPSGLLNGPIDRRWAVDRQPSSAIGRSFPASQRTTGNARHQSSAPRSRSALVMTDTELKVIAAAAIIGLRSRPKSGYSTPAAIG